MTATTRQPVPRPSPEAELPSADCTADSAGGLTFDIALPGASERWDAALLLHGGGADPEPVRLPLVPSGEGFLRAVLPSTMTIAEGRWKASLVLGDAAPIRLRSGRHDLRSLVARVPRSGRTWLGVRIPYRTQNGSLSVRSWLRWPHAEAGEVAVSDGVMTVRGRLHGETLAPGAQLELRAREGHEVALSVPLTLDGPRFSARVSLRDLQTRDGEDFWMLWLRPGEGLSEVRVARILDDIADKRYVVRYPAVPFARGELAIRPGYTGDNDLALRSEKHLSVAESREVR